jgi:hypothetical protein
MSTPSEIMCLQPEQLPVWTKDDAESSALDTLLLMAARMAFLFPHLYAEGKEDGSEALRKITDNLLRLIQTDRGRDAEATWFRANVEVLQQFRDKVRRDLSEEGLFSGTGIVGGSNSSPELIESHIIPQQLVGHALIFQAHCNSCNKEFEVDESIRTRGMEIVDCHDSGDSGLQEIIDGLVRSMKNNNLTLGNISVQYRLWATWMSRLQGKINILEGDSGYSPPTSSIRIQNFAGILASSSNVPPDKVVQDSSNHQMVRSYIRIYGVHNRLVKRPTCDRQTHLFISRGRAQRGSFESCGSKRVSSGMGHPRLLLPTDAGGHKRNDAASALLHKKRGRQSPRYAQYRRRSHGVSSTAERNSGHT